MAGPRAVALLVSLPAALSAALAATGGPDAPPPPMTLLLKSAQKAVFAHMMVSYRTRAFSGTWRGWDYSNARVRHNPDATDEAGRRHIASVYYPAVGPYDMTDPDLVEYHCQLIKMTGLDGVMFDLAFYSRPESQWCVKSMRLYAEAMERYDLRAVVVYEDKCHWIWNRDVKTRSAAVKAAHADMTAWLSLFDRVQYRIGTRPLLLLFSYGNDVKDKGICRLRPAELDAWRKQFPPERRPMMMTQWFQPKYAGVLNGQYDWPQIDGQPPPGSPFRTYTDFAGAKRIHQQRERQALHWLKTGQTDFHIAGAWPGFDDRGCWGWGKGPRFIPRLDGKMYRYQWERAIRSRFPIVQIATWNDWFEGTNIEPSAEFGTKCLQITREFVARFKGKKPPAGDLNTPERIYRIRKETKEQRALEAARRASELIRAGKYRESAAATEPWLKTLGARR